MPGPVLGFYSPELGAAQLQSGGAPVTSLIYRSGIKLGLLVRCLSVLMGMGV